MRVFGILTVLIVSLSWFLTVGTPQDLRFDVASESGSVDEFEVFVDESGDAGLSPLFSEDPDLNIDVELAQADLGGAEAVDNDADQGGFSVLWLLGIPLLALALAGAINYSQRAIIN